MTSKPCTKCGETKPLDLFPRSKKARDGRDTRCKACAAAHVRAYAKANPEKVKASAQATYQKHKEKRDAYRKAWHQSNPEARRAHRKKWRDENYELAREIERASYENNKEARREHRREYFQRNKARYNAHVQKRKAMLLRAIPAWADLAAIAAIYEQRSLISQETGVVHHVDHIVPLQSPVVCGLHVENNLRIIEATANRRKFNKLIETECAGLIPLGRATPGVGGASQGAGGFL